MNNSSIQLQELWNAACHVRQNAYAPYSNYLVGASLYTQNSPEIFTGCNVENASFGATLCAERNAIFSAVARLGKIVITDLVLVTKEPAPPCGLCLQVLSEFSNSETRIFLATQEKIFHKRHLHDFLPIQFSPSNL